MRSADYSATAVACRQRVELVYKETQRTIEHFQTQLCEPGFNVLRVKNIYYDDFDEKKYHKVDARFLFTSSSPALEKKVPYKKTLVDVTGRATLLKTQRAM